jgi:hypothetical protein
VAYNIHPIDREQVYLVPPSLRDWLPEDDLAWFIIDAVKQMDLSRFYAKYRQESPTTAPLPASGRTTKTSWRDCLCRCSRCARKPGW